MRIIYNVDISARNTGVMYKQGITVPLRRLLHALTVQQRQR